MLVIVVVLVLMLALVRRMSHFLVIVYGHFRKLLNECDNRPKTVIRVGWAECRHVYLTPFASSILRKIAQSFL